MLASIKPSAESSQAVLSSTLHPSTALSEAGRRGDAIENISAFPSLQLHKCGEGLSLAVEGEERQGRDSRTPGWAPVVYSMPLFRSSCVPCIWVLWQGL